MLVAAELAGFFAAHAVWSLAEEGEFFPMLAYAGQDKRHAMERFADTLVERAVFAAREKLSANAMQAGDAAIVFDGRVQSGTEPVDAIVTEMRSYAAPWAEASIAVPYTPKTAGAFRIHIPLLVAWRGCENFNKEAVMQAFFKGVNGHEMGSKIWNESYDETR